MYITWQWSRIACCENIKVETNSVMLPDWVLIKWQPTTYPQAAELTTVHFLSNMCWRFIMSSSGRGAHEWEHYSHHISYESTQFDTNARRLATCLRLTDAEVGTSYPSFPNKFPWRWSYKRSKHVSEKVNICYSTANVHVVGSVWFIH